MKTRKNTRRHVSADPGKRAEKKVKAVKTASPEKPSVAGTQRLIHEPPVHQIELEVQNEELRLAQQQLDITERKRAERALEESEERYRRLFEVVTDAILVVDRDSGRFVEANPAALKLYGYSRQEFLSLTHREVSAEPEETLRAIATAQALVPLSWHLKKDGTRFPVEIVGNYFTFQGHEFHVAAIRDISERKRAEELLSQAMERLSLAQHAGRVGVFDWNLTTGHVVWTPELEEIFGLPPGTFENRYEGWAKRVHPKDLPRIEATFAAWFKSRLDVEQWEYRYLRQGEERWILARGQLFRDKAGRPARMLGTNMDITERKRAEETLRRTQFSVDSASVAITWIRPDATFAYVNDAGCRMVGCSREQYLRKTVPDINTSMTLEKWQSDWEQLKERGSLRYESVFITEDRRLLPVEVIVNYLAFEGFEFCCGFARDITERMYYEEQLLECQGQLRSLAAELSRAEQEERRRLASLLHDDVIQSMALARIKLGTLLKSLPDAEQRSEIERTRAFIEQAIQTTRSLTFQLSPPILHELGLESALDWLAEQFAKHHGLPCKFSSDAQPKPLAKDVTWVLFMAVREVLVNAAKHAHAAQAEVGSCRDGAEICITVTDNGVGFDPEAVVKHTGKSGGFGLLNIRERLGYLGGSSELRSEPGQGTRVILRAPLVAG